MKGVTRGDQRGCAFLLDHGRPAITGLLGEQSAVEDVGPHRPAAEDHLALANDWSGLLRYRGRRLPPLASEASDGRKAQVDEFNGITRLGVPEPALVGVVKALQDIAHLTHV